MSAMERPNPPHVALGWEGEPECEAFDMTSTASGFLLTPFVSAGHCVHRKKKPRTETIRATVVML